MIKLWTRVDISLFHGTAVWSLSVTESKTHVSPIDGRTTIQLVMWKRDIQRSFSINFLCGMFDDMLVGAVFVDDHMKGQNEL
jgi:hypothetical protein